MRAIDEKGEGGFTLIEIMVSMVILVIGLLGILALQMTTVKGNRMSRNLERGKVFATAMMEDLRSRPLDGTFAAIPFPTVTTADGVTYTRSFTATAVAGSTTMMLVTTTVTFAENDDPSDTHTATLQMLRTVPESLP